MKVSFTILLLLALFLQSFQQSIVVADYYLNTARYARNCVNKALPKLHCNGKCQMMKKLKEEEKKQQQTPSRKLENGNDVLSSRSFFANTIPGLAIVPNSLPLLFNENIQAGTGRKIFHPPLPFLSNSI